MKKLVLGLIVLGLISGHAFSEECRPVKNLNNYYACVENIVHSGNIFILENPSLAGLDIKPSSHVAKEICKAFEGSYLGKSVRVLSKSEGTGKWSKRQNDLYVTGPLGADTFPSNIIGKIKCLKP